MDRRVDLVAGGLRPSALACTPAAGSTCARLGDGLRAAVSGMALGRGAAAVRAASVCSIRSTSIHVCLTSRMAARLATAPRCLSVLDWVAGPLRTHVEKTYSAPFATHLYAKETIQKRRRHRGTRVPASGPRWDAPARSESRPASRHRASARAIGGRRPGRLGRAGADSSWYCVLARRRRSALGATAKCPADRAARGAMGHDPAHGDRAH